MHKHLAGLGRGRRGIALPIALIGLIGVSLVVTTVMITSSTEFAISSAHRTAAASLFSADAALEQYVADRAAVGGEFLKATSVANPAAVVEGPDGTDYSITVARLSWTPAASADPKKLAADEVFSLVAEPVGGRGRGVGAFLALQRLSHKVDLNLNAGATSGGNLNVTGNATISDGRTGTNYCANSDNQADYAVQVTAGSRIDVGHGQNASDRLEGAGDTLGYTKDKMEDSLMGGVRLHELAQQANIKFGTGAYWSEPAFQTTVINSDATTPIKYNWGCPSVLGVTCPSAASRERHVSVAIDAQGGTVRINGRYGQGLLIVINGSLEIQGNFTFKGIILVENDVIVRGGSAGQESKIEGGIVSFGANSTVDDNITGTATIKYNLCAITDAENAMNQNSLLNAAQHRTRSTYSWYELIR
jgi:hypothetical protein